MCINFETSEAIIVLANRNFPNRESNYREYQKKMAVIFATNK